MLNRRHKRSIRKVQTCTALTTRNQIIDSDAVMIGWLHNVKQLVFDVLHVDLSAHNFKRLPANGAQKIVDIKHGEEPRNKDEFELYARQDGDCKTANPRFFRSSSLKKYLIPFDVDRCSQATWNSQNTLKSISPPNVWLSCCKRSLKIQKSEINSLSREAVSNSCNAPQTNAR